MLCCSLQRLQKESTAPQTHCCSVIPAGEHDCSSLSAGCIRNKRAMSVACVLQAPASKQTAASILQEPAEIVQLYRYPGLSKSAAAALLRKVSLTCSSSCLTVFCRTAPCNRKPIHLCHCKLVWCNQVQHTVSSEIESIDAELVSYMLPLPICVVSPGLVHGLIRRCSVQCFNIAFSSPLTADEASTLTW